MNHKKTNNRYTTDTNNPNNPIGIKNYFQRIIENLPNNVYWLNRDCITMGCNRNTLKLVGLEKMEDFIGISYEEMGRLANWTEGQALAFKRDDMEVMETKQAKFSVEEPPLYDKENNPIYYLSSRVPLFDDKENVIGVLGISTDVTQFKKLQKEFAELKISEERFKTMSAMGGMIAHELRTPLMAIKAATASLHRFLPTLLSSYELNLAADRIEKPLRKDHLEGLKTLLSDVDHYINYSQSIISTILSGFKYTLTNKKIEFKAFSLSNCIKEAIDQYPLTEPQKKLIYYQCNEQLTVYGDKQTIIYTLQNLLKNALQSIDKAGKGTITINASQEKNNIILSFQDTGGGISENTLQHIFEPFYTTKDKQASSIGLGLYFCKTALDKMNATIQCQSSLNKYAKFEIVFQQAAN